MDTTFSCNVDADANYPNGLIRIKLDGSPSATASASEQLQELRNVMRQARATDHQAAVVVTLRGEVVLHVKGSRPVSPWSWRLLQSWGLLTGANRSLGFVRFQVTRGVSLEELIPLARSAEAIHPRIDVIGTTPDGSTVLYLPAGAEHAAQKAFVLLWLQRLGILFAAVVVYVIAVRAVVGLVK